MVGRVSSFGQQQLLIRNIFQNQQALFEDQRQVSTGKRVDDFKGLAGDTGTILGSRSFKSRIETYQQTIDTIRGKLNANDVQLGGIVTAAEELKENIQTVLANGNAQGFGELLEQTFRFSVNSLNTNIDGTYLFSGAETGTVPVNVSTLAELDTTEAAGSTADAFDNASIAFEARIADGVNLEFGLLASDVATSFFDEILALHRQDIATPFQGEIDPSQFSFLQNALQSLDSTIEELRLDQVSNGLSFERLEVVDEQHADSVVFLETFIADQEDVNIAEAVTRLNNDQVALEASFQAISSLNQLTLLRFL
ncbi:flagellin [Kordiimonas aquimaris]|uniref:flagellin n=1 Tax=Kordiimonas aquimaris TaxID=707591 RepID=UPI0021D3CCF6|nr:flagellin [Kordiimonas aquimaris]